MRTQFLSLLVVLAGAGCSAGPRAPAATSNTVAETRANEPAARHVRKASPPAPAPNDAAPANDSFAADRQVSELYRAIALYEQFIERAHDQPEFAEAVRRSCDRIEDAHATIVFLTGGEATEEPVRRPYGC